MEKSLFALRIFFLVFAAITCIVSRASGDVQDSNAMLSLLGIFVIFNLMWAFLRWLQGLSDGGDWPPSRPVSPSLPPVPVEECELEEAGK